jgi:hypothetical protein
MLHTIAQQLELSLSQLKAHLAYKYGVNEEGFYNGLACFETLPESVRESLLKEVGLTEAEVELKDQQDNDQDETEEEDQDEGNEEQKDAPTDEKSLNVTNTLKLDPTPAPKSSK